MSKKTVHFANGSDKEGITYCGQPYKLRLFPDISQKLQFSSIVEHVTCTKCQRKLKENAKISERLKEFHKKIDKEFDDSKDDTLLGYFEAISNLCGEFNNGMCVDCPFCYEVVGTDFESCQPEAILHCRLDRCWIDEVKEIIVGTSK